jgi:hypothetical protein
MGGGERGEGCHPSDLLCWLTVTWSGAPADSLGGMPHTGMVILIPGPNSKTDSSGSIHSIIFHYPSQGSLENIRQLKLKQIRQHVVNSWGLTRQYSVDPNTLPSLSCVAGVCWRQSWLLFLIFVCHDFEQIGTGTGTVHTTVLLNLLLTITTVTYLNT